MLIKHITKGRQLLDAYHLIKRTFNKTQTKYYSDEGIASFNDMLKEAICICSLFPDAMLFLGAYNGSTLTGTCVCKDAHISMLFVDGKYQRKGIGKKLINEVKARLKAQKYKKLTVYAAPNAVEFYRKQGFVVMGGKCCHDGIEYIPMQAVI